MQHNVLLLSQDEPVQPQLQPNIKPIVVPQNVLLLAQDKSKDGTTLIPAPSSYAATSNPRGTVLRPLSAVDDTPRPNGPFNFSMAAAHPAQTSLSASLGSGGPKTPPNATLLPDYFGTALVAKNTQRPFILYQASFPGLWNDHMRTPFTKRINADSRVYFTESPRNAIQDAPQPMLLGDDPDTLTNEEWMIIRASQAHLARSRNPAYAHSDALDDELE